MNEYLNNKIEEYSIDNKRNDIINKISKAFSIGASSYLTILSLGFTYICPPLTIALLGGITFFNIIGYKRRKYRSLRIEKNNYEIDHLNKLPENGLKVDDNTNKKRRNLINKLDNAIGEHKVNKSSGFGKFCKGLGLAAGIIITPFVPVVGVAAALGVTAIEALGTRKDVKNYSKLMEYEGRRNNLMTDEEIINSNNNKDNNTSSHDNTTNNNSKNNTYNKTKNINDPDINKMREMVDAISKLNSKRDLLGKTYDNYLNKNNEETLNNDVKNLDKNIHVMNALRKRMQAIDKKIGELNTKYHLAFANAIRKNNGLDNTTYNDEKVYKKVR